MVDNLKCDLDLVPQEANVQMKRKRIALETGTLGDAAGNYGDINEGTASTLTKVRKELGLRKWSLIVKYLIKEQGPAASGVMQAV